MTSSSVSLGSVLALAMLVAVFAEDAATVTELDDTNFDDFIASHDRVFVEFYAPWCSVCKKLVPEVERAAQLLAESDLGVTVAKVNANELEELRDRFGVDRTPRFFLFRNGDVSNPTRYLTYKSGEAMFSKLVADLSPDTPVPSPTKHFGDDMSTLVEWLFWRGTDYGRLESAAVIFYPERAAANAELQRDIDEALAVFNKVATKLVTKMRYAAVESASIIRAFKLPDDQPVIALYTDHDEGRFVFDGEVTPEVLKKFFLDRLVPMVTDVDHLNLIKVANGTPLLMHLFVSEEELEDPKLHEEVKNQATTLARHLLKEKVFDRGEFTIGITNGNKYWEWLAQFGMTKATPLPAIGINHKAAGGKMYKAPKNVFKGAVGKPPAPGTGSVQEPAGLPWRVSLASAAHFINGASLGVVAEVTPIEAHAHSTEL